MPASYPSSAKTFTTKSNATTADASHINDVQLEITAIEQDLIAGLAVGRGGTGNTTLTANRVLLGNGSSAVAVAGAGTSGQVLTSNGASAPTFQDALTASSTTTLTNKRITKRITTITSHATPTINTDDCDCVTITAQAAALTSMTTNLSGTPTNFQPLIFRIKDNGTARAITWGASFEAKGVALPTTTVISKVLTVGFLYDTVTSKWGCVASAQET